MTKTSSPPVEVLPCDREEAAEAYNLLGFGPCQHIIDGVEDDVGIVQLFARHRARTAASSLNLLADYQRFAGETAGKCLGLAMSGDNHPDPDGVLMGIFEESQHLAAKARGLAQAAESGKGVES